MDCQTGACSPAGRPGLQKINQNFTFLFDIKILIPDPNQVIVCILNIIFLQEEYFHAQTQRKQEQSQSPERRRRRFCIRHRGKNAEKDQLNEELASIQAGIADLKAQLKEKRAALKSVDKAIAKLEAQKTAAEAKAAQQARQAEIDSALQKLIADGMSVDQILDKLK